MGPQTPHGIAPNGIGYGMSGYVGHVFGAVIAGLFFIIVTAIVIAVLFFLIRFLIIGTKAAELYIARHSDGAAGTQPVAETAVVAEPVFAEPVLAEPVVAEPVATTAAQRTRKTPPPKTSA